jgi:predicted kinase
MTTGSKQRLFEIMEKINPDFQSEKPKFIIPVGISGSGKSRWIKSLEGQGFIVVSPDDIRRELTGSISDQSRNNDVFPLAFKRTIDALNSGKNVIFDATNVSSYHRKSMLDTIKRSVSTDFDAFAKIFDADPEISKQRIRKDIENGVDRSNVPDFAVDKQYQNFTKDLSKVEDDGYTIIQ